MNEIITNVKMRKATIEDFIWLDFDGHRKLKMGFPFYVKSGDEMNFSFIKLLKGEEKKEQWNWLQNKLRAECIYVLDPIFTGDEKLIINKN